jgi:hypothetical protein
MHNKTGRLLMLVMLLLSGGITFAEDNDRTAILALMQRAFDAVSSGNPDDWRAIQLAEGTSLSFRPGPDGNPDRPELRISSNEALLSGETEHGHQERWTGDPTVMIRGPIAVVWGEYEYLINGEFSHCGIDSADVVKIDGDWKIANWMWTVEKARCPTAPSQPNKE